MNRYHFATSNLDAVVVDLRRKVIVSRNCPLSTARQIAERAFYAAAICQAANVDRAA